MIKVTKGKVLIKQLDSQTNLGNGLSITNETQSRKDVVRGEVIDGEYEIGTVVFFPLYASLPISYEGINYLIVDIGDILAYDTGYIKG